MNKKQAAEKFTALSEPIRVEITKLVSKNPGITASALVKKLHMPQPTLSHHIRILCTANLLDTKQEGRWSHYFIHTDIIDKMADFLDELK